jgi:hypothetical protein
MAEQPPAIQVPPSAAVASTPGRTDSTAIAALVVGAISPMAAMFYGVPGVIAGSIAVFLGLSSRRRIKRSGGTLHGGGLALAGWIVGVCGILLGLVVAVFLFGLFMAMQPGTGKGG